MSKTQFKDELRIECPCCGNSLEDSFFREDGEEVDCKICQKC